MMLRIGITGGIGSGKTTVCSIFQELGIPVYSADDRAKALMSENEVIRSGITELFGQEAYSDGQLNRQHIAQIAFSDPEKLTALNQLVHPAVIEDFRTWSLQEEAKGTPYVIKEAALMFESGSYKDLDAVITVSAPEELRIQRTMDRDGSTREAVLGRLNKQWNEDQRLNKADLVIYNDGEQALIPQVMKLHNRFIKGKLKA